MSQQWIGNQFLIYMISNQSSFASMKERDIRQSYVFIHQIQEGFHSQRHETSHSMNQNQDGLELRGLTRQFHIKYPVQTLLTHFRQIFNLRGFKTTQVFPGKIMIVKLTLLDRLKFILSSKQPCRYLLTIKTQQYKSMRKVIIKKLKDHPNVYYEKDIQQVRELFNWIDSNPVTLPEFRDKNNSVNDFQTSSEYQQDLYSLQATSTYMYHKIFVDRNYSMAKKMQKIVHQNKEPLNELSNRQAAIIVGGLKQITEDMLKGFNCTRKQLLEILCHCRKTVEDYYHDRKFTLKSKQKIQFQRGSIQTQIAQKMPQTVKSFQRLVQQTNSHKIIRQIFMTHYIFQIECQLGSIGESERQLLAKKLGGKFYNQIQNKMKTLDLWGYPDNFYNEYLHDFIN